MVKTITFHTFGGEQITASAELSENEGNNTSTSITIKSPSISTGFEIQSPNEGKGIVFQIFGVAEREALGEALVVLGQELIKNKS